ncbi:LOW QUALITY PROTEIN: hypothetical protein ACHAW5_000829 [Stephanodiscus triporus]|uniref:Peptidase M11 gametolysin domain-containing protein n=1 Tax=Stephanodiscus triporus TaxID=2934178 RepID=A0ABD3PSA0_9STRA
MLAPDLDSPSIDGEDDEIFQCTIDPDDVPGGYAGLTRKLDLSRTQKHAFTKMWKEGRLVPGQTKLKLAEIDEATEMGEVAGMEEVEDIEDVAEMGEDVDETTVATDNVLEGLPIVVSNIQIPTELDVEDLLVDGDVNRDRELQTSFGSHVGIKPTLVVKVFDVNDKARSETAMQISDDIFGTNGDPVNLRSQMSACSMGRVDFVPGDNNNVIDQGLYDAPGVITVKIDISLENNSRTDIENAITAKVQDKLQMKLPGPYKHVCTLLRVAMSNAAYAYVNNYISVYQGKYYKDVAVSMHEIGHNFGLGNPHYEDDTGKMCYNPAKNWQIGWYNDRKKMLTPPSQASWETMETIVGIADYQKNNMFPVVLKLETGTSNDYFVGFNRAAGINEDNKEADNQLTIVQSGKNGDSFSQSWLKATLKVSDQYTLENFGGVSGTNIVIILDSIDKQRDGSWQANVKVIKSSSKSSPSRKPSANPTRPPTSKPTSATPTSSSKSSSAESRTGGSDGDQTTMPKSTPTTEPQAKPTKKRKHHQ